MYEGRNPQIEVVLSILKDEVDGNVDAALARLAPDYSMTWMYLSSTGQPFPTTSQNIEGELEEAYAIRGRSYDVRSIAEGGGTVFVELIERYRDPKTQRLYATPLVLVLDMDGNAIRAGRHYCDPRLSHADLPGELIDAALRNKQSLRRIQ